jgi:hypothetical protein
MMKGEVVICAHLLVVESNWTGKLSVQLDLFISWNQFMCTSASQQVGESKAHDFLKELNVLGQTGGDDECRMKGWQVRLT